MQALTIEAVDPFESYLEALPNGIIVIDAAEEIIYANNIAEHWLQPKLIGQSWARLMKTIGVKKITDKSWMSLTNGRDIKMAVNTLSQFEGQVILLQARSQSKRRSWLRVARVNAKRKFGLIKRQFSACDSSHLINSIVHYYQHWSLAFYDGLRSLIERALNQIYQSAQLAQQKIQTSGDAITEGVDIGMQLRAFHAAVEPRLEDAQSRMWVDVTGPIFLFPLKMNLKTVLDEFLALSFEYHDAVELMLGCDYHATGLRLSLMYQGLSVAVDAPVQDVRAREQDPLKAIKDFNQRHQGTLSIEGDLASQLMVTLSLPKSTFKEISPLASMIDSLKARFWSTR